MSDTVKLREALEAIETCVGSTNPSNIGLMKAAIAVQIDAARASLAATQEPQPAGHTKYRLVEAGKLTGHWECECGADLGDAPIDEINEIALEHARQAERVLAGAPAAPKGNSFERWWAEEWVGDDAFSFNSQVEALAKTVAEAAWGAALGYVAPAASGRELKRNDEVWLRAKVMTVQDDSVAVAPYCIENMQGSVRVVLSDVSKAAAPRPELAPTEMNLCEIPRLILHKDQPYIFRQADGCADCAAYLAPAEREAPPDLAGALERLVKEWRQPLEVESPLQGVFKKHYEYQRRKCADELAAQLKVQR